MISPDLAGRARRAYELGRLRRAARALLLVAPIVGLATLLPGALAGKLVAGATLAALAVGLGWAGGAAGRAVVPGLLGGAAPLLLPSLIGALDSCPAGSGCAPLCIPACLGAGLLAGLIVLEAARGAETSRGGRRAFLAGAIAEAALAGTMGCAFLGLTGVLSMFAMLLVPAMPALVARRSS